MKSFARFVSAAMIGLSAAAFALPAGAEEVRAATPAPEQQQGSFYWRGDVDGTVDLHVRHRSVRVVVKAGRSLQCARYRFDGALPKRDGVCRSRKWKGAAPSS
ncbi:MAG: hypothetical protein HZT41_05640 [Dechloromonas sp.]|nr:MAG: hypothetical protein HZT41_05640 [Dechloromonas sp.]